MTLNAFPVISKWDDPLQGSAPAPYHAIEVHLTDIPPTLSSGPPTPNSRAVQLFRDTVATFARSAKVTRGRTAQDDAVV